MPPAIVRTCARIGRGITESGLIAWAEGIHSCPIGLREEAVASEALGLPETHYASIGLAFGYPDPNATPSESGPRLPLDELVH